MVYSPLVKLGPIGISLVLITLTLLKALQAPRALFDAAHFLPFWWVYFVPFPCRFFISHFSPCLTSVSLSLPLSIISPSSWLAFFLSALKSLLCLLPESAAAGRMKSGVLTKWGSMPDICQESGDGGRNAWKELCLFAIWWLGCFGLWRQKQSNQLHFLRLLFIPKANISEQSPSSHRHLPTYI